MGSSDGRGGNVSADTAVVIDGLNDLLKLDHDAIGAYEIAIEQLQDREHALQIEGFKRDHETHIRALNELILELGGAPSNEPHVSGPLKQALQRIVAGAGDRAILSAWRTNELQVMTKYDRYAQKAVFWSAEVKRLIDEHALDEERHYAWVVTLLGKGEAPELHLANRMREGVSRARHFGEQAQGRLGQAADGARLRAARGLEEAAGQLDQLAARQMGEPGFRGRAADGAQKIARGFHSTATFLREPGDGGGLSSVEEVIRASPGRALVATFAVGFVVGRIIR
jgi:rubrerythrin